jgi:hypothetical protein
METSLQNTNLTADELAALPSEHEGEYAGEEEAHIHLPNPSYWPILVSAAILIAIIGFLFVNLVVILIGAVLVFITIIGWGLEDPMAGVGAKEEVKPGQYATSYQEAAATGKPTALAESVLYDAQDVVDNKVTISSTEWSAHPVKVFIEREGVVLSLYGKVELEAQKKEVEDALRKLPGVIDVMNFLIAEDALLNAVNARIEELKKQGKLEGATNIAAQVENYIVSLYGEVPDPKMRYALEKEIIGIPGVRVVINHIGLNKDIPGNMGKTINRVGP